MFESRLKRYTLEQRNFIAEHYFYSNSYQTTLQLYEKWFNDTPYGGTMKQIVEQFRMKYTLANALRLGRPHAFSDNDRTKITEHADENPGVSVCRVTQELGQKCKMVCTTLKRERYFSNRISMLHKLKPEDCTPCCNYCDWFFEKFGRDVETVTTIFFFRRVVSFVGVC